MKDLEKDKMALRSSRERAITVGIAALIVLFLLWLSEGRESLGILIVITWVILYIDYRLLKLKIEILQELSTEKEMAKSQSKIDS